MFEVKVYLIYKTITSQNMSSNAHVKNFFISQKSYFPFSRYSFFCIFNFPMIYQIFDVMMSTDRVQGETGCIFEYFLNHSSLRHPTWPIDRYTQGQLFSEIV